VARANRSGRERELKLGVRDDALFDALLEAAGGERDAPSVQENHFFDTPDRRFSRIGLALRIRCEKDAWTLTLKGPTRPDAGPMLADRAEIECALEPARAAEALRSGDPAKRLLAVLSQNHAESALLAAACEASERAPLALLGGFHNARTRVRTALAAGGKRFAVTLEFDRTEFAPDDVRREVELEFTPGDPEDLLRDALLAIFRRVGAEPLPVSGKFAHFLARQERGES
jgi:inorganic triphosphatase YgiF